MRAMPSPTSSTRPTSCTSSLARYWLISVRRTETISSGLNLITASLDQLVAEGFDLVADTGVVLEVADAHGHAPEQVRIDARIQHRIALKHLADLADQAFALVVGQGHGGADPDKHLAGAFLELFLV